MYTPQEIRGYKEEGIQENKIKNNCCSYFKTLITTFHCYLFYIFWNYCFQEAPPCSQLENPIDKCLILVVRCSGSGYPGVFLRIADMYFMVGAKMSHLFLPGVQTFCQVYRILGFARRGGEYTRRNMNQKESGRWRRLTISPWELLMHRE